MTWLNNIATGSGAVEFRLAIEGVKEQWVTASVMAGADGTRVRYVGLKRDGIIIDEQSDLRSGKLKLGGMNLKIADIDGAATAAFSQKPTSQTWLITTATTADTNINVMSTAGWSGSQIHIGTEAMTIDATVDSANWTVTREIWQSIVQKHWTADGEHLRMPMVTNRPACLEGRRARLYGYGSNDLVNAETGALLDGTQIWVGVVSTEPSLGDGATWEIGLDPLTRLWQGDIGEDLEEPVTPRGIYYPWNAPCYLVIEQSAGATPGAGVIADFSITPGFYESQAAFCAQAATDIQAAATAAAMTGTFSAVPDPLDAGAGWRIVYTAANPTPLYVRVSGRSEVDDFAAALFGAFGLLNDVGEYVGTAVAGSTYNIPIAGTVPRGAWGTSTRQRDGRTVEMVPSATTTAPEYRMYLGGAITVDTDMSAAQVEWADTGTTEVHSVSGHSASSRYVTVHRPSPPLTTYPSHVYTREVLPDIKFGREYGTGGSLASFIDAVQDDAPAYANIGGVPFFTVKDTDDGSSIATLTAVINEAAAGRGFLLARRYTAFGARSLEEWIAEECQLLGVFPCLNSSGLLTFRRLKAAVVTEVSSGTIDSSRTLVDGGFPSWGRNAYGMVNTVVLRTGYDPVEDEWKGHAYVVRDVTGFGTNKAPRTEEIKPYSSAMVGEDALTVEQIRSTVSPILFIFGTPYETITVEVPMLLFPVYLGDVVQVTSRQIPDSDDGTRGWSTAKAAQVVGRKWDLPTGRGTLTLLRSQENIAGYAPTMLISSTAIQNPGTDTDHILTVTGADPDGTANAYIPSGTTATSFFTVGDAVRIYEWDATTPTTRKGSVTAVTSTTVRVTFTASWTGLGGVPYLLGYDAASFVVTGQKVYAFEAGTDGLIDFSTAVPARVFGM